MNPTPIQPKIKKHSHQFLLFFFFQSGCSPQPEHLLPFKRVFLTGKSPPKSFLPIFSLFKKYGILCSPMYTAADVELRFLSGIPAAALTFWQLWHPNLLGRRYALPKTAFLRAYRYKLCCKFSVLNFLRRNHLCLQTSKLHSSAK